MAYSSTNPPKLVGQGISGTREWVYTSSDPSTNTDDTDYFADGYQRGMRLNDAITSICTSTSAPSRSDGYVSAASSSGPCTVVYGGLVST